MSALPPDVAKVDFGRLDAESDDNLREYFVDTGAFRRLILGEKQFVVGRKGAGKTALFRQAQNALREVKITPIPIEFADYAWNTHRAIQELGLPREDLYKSSWVFTFLIAACIAWKSSKFSHVREEATAIYRKIYGTEDIGPLNVLIDKLRKVRRIDLPSIDGVGSLGGIEMASESEGTHLARAANAWNPLLLDLARRVAHHHRVTILVDRLDDGWDGSDDAKTMLAGAFKAAREINLKLDIKGGPRSVVIFLRSDIFNQIQFNDKNKISQDIEQLEWNNEALVQVVEARISSSVGGPRQGAWDRVFDKQVMRQGASIRSYILKRTMKRPRDIVAFAQCCKESALVSMHRSVATSDVYDAEVNYSRHIYRELVDEMHKQVPEYENLFQVLSKVAYSRFGFQDWLTAARQIRPDLAAEEGRAMLLTLFEYGVVGRGKVGGSGGGSAVEYVYDELFRNVSLDGDIVVHPSLRKHLKMKDRRTDSIDGEDAQDAD
jgi:hypothetical protein